MTQGRRFHFALTIFGDEYVQRFLEAGLPSQLSPGNLPALVQGPMRPRYHLFTPPAEARTIRNAMVFRHLTALVDVEFHDIESQVAAFRSRQCSPYDIMNSAYLDILRTAYADGGALIAIWPDVLFSDGTFRRLKELEAQGIRGVATTSNQAATTLATEARKRYLDSASGALILPPRQLIALLLDHLTPYWTQFFADDPRFPSEDATHIQWRVGSGGILTRSSYFHPILAVPTEGACAFGSNSLWNGLDTTDFLATLTSDFERDIHFVRDSDEFCTVGLDLRTTAFRNHPRQLNRAEMALALARTAHAHTRTFLSQSIRFHSTGIDAAWDEQEAEAQTMAEEIVGLLEVLQVHPSLRTDLLILQARGSQTPDNEDFYRQVAVRVHSWARDWQQRELRVAIHGAGAWAKKLLCETSLSNCEIAGVVDSNPALQGTSFLRWTVQSPFDLLTLTPDVILVTALRAQEDIVAQLGETKALRAKIQRLFPMPSGPEGT